MAFFVSQCSSKSPYLIISPRTGITLRFVAFIKFSLCRLITIHCSILLFISLFTLHITRLTSIFFACSYPRNLYNLFMIIIIVVFIIIAIIITIVFIIAVNIIIVAGRLFRLIKFFFTIAKFSCFTHQLLKKAQFSNDHSCKMYFTKSKKKQRIVYIWGRAVEKIFFLCSGNDKCSFFRRSGRCYCNR